MSRFRYRSSYHPALRCNEVRIESLTAQKVSLESLQFTTEFSPGELIDAEVMWKFDPDELMARCRRFHFPPVRVWIDPVHRYGLFLLRRH